MGKNVQCFVKRYHYVYVGLLYDVFLFSVDNSLDSKHEHWWEPNVKYIKKSSVWEQKLIQHICLAHAKSDTTYLNLTV